MLEFLLQLSVGKGMAARSSALAWRIPGTGACWAAVHGVIESDTTDATQQQQQLSEGESLKGFLTSEQT